MPPKKNAYVFVVEDNPDVSDSLKAVITAMGHQCATFDAAETLLEQGDLSQCDCLLVDFNLPGMTGTELLAQLHRRESCPRAALYTGQIDSRVREAAAKLDSTPVIEKGNDVSAILTQLSNMLAEAD
ncbi:MAG: response regulator [Pirellulaceae bacterium]|nr:response regulator [Pirellulaceae bacterium]